ncbi:unnamed protein product [Kluyveromyces dobzhanskii CBS 2104]|uniref:Mitochondrial import inner membrane translocase subunit TIM54 n=1 Tax=Kluyveromyces dobzhanskii CBS 2104 TaxID=1427455 RepID=A0A0A8LAU1_9SACH|nr:unnamed protein product [Kluyveromyces dobzhanskii CBS 2104]
MWKKLPSPGWLAFGTVVSAGASGIAYDKYQQSQTRSLYMAHVEKGATSPLESNLKPRKLIVLVAPPPNDYLDTSLTLWRRWIKPILYSSGLDYEIVTGNKQGEIRSEVASRIRQLRKDLISQEQDQTEEKSWSWSSWFKSGRNTAAQETAVEEEQAKPSPFDIRSVLGVFYHNEPKPVILEDSLVDPSVAGGVICVGRGAYKEYIAGIHEGILGPLEEPSKVVAAASAAPAETVSSGTVDSETLVGQTPLGTSVEASPVEASPVEVVPVETTAAEAAPAEAAPAEAAPAEAAADEDSSEKKKDVPVPKAYILPSEYSNASIPAELSKPLIIDPKTGAPAFFEQPLLVVAVPNLSGFTTIPTRISRFYQKRFLCEQVSHSTLAAVESKSRPFTTTDLDLGAYEELDWPKSWVETGKERGSEWVQPLQGDDRVLHRLRVVEPALVPSIQPETTKENDEFNTEKK